MHIVCGGHFWQLGSIAPLATETIGGEILVTFLAQTWPQKRSQMVPNFKIFLGEHAPRTQPPSLFTLKRTQSEKGGSSPV